MFESRSDDPLVKLVKTVEPVEFFETVETLETVETVETVETGASGDSGDSSFAYAKEYKNRTVYFLSFFRGNIYDPYGVYSHKRNSREIEFKKVTKQSFDLYLNYLDTRNRSFLTLAERKYVNG